MRSQLSFWLGLVGRFGISRLLEVTEEVGDEGFGSAQAVVFYTPLNQKKITATGVKRSLQLNILSHPNFLNS